MKNYTKYFILIFASIAVGCTDFDSMNKNPYALYETSSESFVQPILYNTEKIVIQRCYDILSEIMQYTISNNVEATATLAYNYVINENYSRVLWTLYNQYGNAQYMLNVARNEENPAMTGVALVLRSFIAQILTDTYGNVPYSKAGLIATQGDKFEYTVPYDNQKDIYFDLMRSLEEANACFNKAKEMQSTGALTDINFNPICDYMFGGNVEKWQRFGNSLYLRLLMRSSIKVLADEGGIISLGDEYGDFHIVSKLNEFYDSFTSGDGTYPLMRNLHDSARIKFSSKDSALYTPFNSTTSGSWGAERLCETLANMMLISYKANDEENSIFDPRFYRIFNKAKGGPTQKSREEMEEYFGSNGPGRYAYGVYVDADVNSTNDKLHIGDMKMDATYALLNYDELYFIFAEAGARGWISMSPKIYKDLYLEANRQSILQWQVGWETAPDYYTESSPEFKNFINHLDSTFEDSKAVETILTQKYVATLWVGVESWSDYRRTGYPVLKTNGPAAQNKKILPTRFRYPATEAFQNAKWYEESVNGWLNGDNDMLHDVWWADTNESKAIRLLGRQ